jgi:hypothetical protein
MIRSIYDDEDICLNIETVICKVYFPQFEMAGSHALTWPTSSFELKQQQNVEIRRFNVSHKSFAQFFDLITSSIIEPSTDIECFVLDYGSDWVAVRDNEQWTKALSNARRESSKKHKQLRVKVTTRDGSSVTPKPNCGSSRKTKSVRKNVSCCIVPTKTEAYPCESSANFLSIKQDFCDLQKQMEAMRLQQQGQPKEMEKRKKKKVSSEKKKRSSKNAPAEIVTQMVYSEYGLFNNWSPSKWGSGSHSSSSIAVL